MNESSFARLVKLLPEWAQYDRYDAWLYAAIQQRLRVGSLFLSQCAAAGMIARFSISKAHREARLWARDLTSTERFTLETGAILETVALEEALFMHFETRQYTSNAWWEGLLLLCHQRDDIEGYRVLLREGPDCDPTQLVRQLEALDARCQSLVQALPHCAFDDERSARIVIGDPRAWWAIGVPYSAPKKRAHL